MSAYPGSVSDGPSIAGSASGKTLVSGVNWLGDSVMSMPAVQELKRRDRSVNISVLVKGPLVPLWRLHPDVDSVIELIESPAGTFKAAKVLRNQEFERAFVLPHSFRSSPLSLLFSFRAAVAAFFHSSAFIRTSTSWRKVAISCSSVAKIERSGKNVRKRSATDSFIADLRDEMCR